MRFLPEIGGIVMAWNTVEIERGKWLEFDGGEGRGEIVVGEMAINLGEKLLELAGIGALCGGVSVDVGVGLEFNGGECD